MTVSTLTPRRGGLNPRLKEVAGVLNRAHAQLVQVTAEAIATDAWMEEGIASVTHWLVLRAGVSRGRAGAIVAAAQRWDELPATFGFLETGVLSLEHVGPIVRRVPASYEQSVAELAQFATVPQIERATRCEFPDPTPEPEPEPEPAPAEAETAEGETPAEESPAGSAFGLGDPPPGVTVPDKWSAQARPASLTMRHDDDGRFHLHYEAPSDVGALVENAVRESTDALWRLLNCTPATDEAADVREDAPAGAATNAGDDRPATKAAAATGTRIGHGAPATAPANAASHAQTGDSDAATDGATTTPGANTRATADADLPTGTTNPAGTSAGPAAQPPLPLGPAPDTGTRPPRSTRPGPPKKNVRVSLAEGFAHLARRNLASIPSPSRQNSYRVYVHLDTNGGWLTGRPRLPRHLTEKLTCDGHLQPVWETDGVPVSVGRTQRAIPNRTKRLVLDRDRGCRVPGCGLTRGLDVHHIWHWILGGPTDIDNLVALCSHHHDALHRGDFTITGNPNAPDAHPAGPPTPGEGLRFETRTGLPLNYIPPTPSRAPLPAGDTYSGPTGEKLQTHWVTFTRNPTPVPRAS